MTALLDALIAGRQAAWPMTMVSILAGAAGALLLGVSA
jgi:hypothetical protein